MPHVWQDNPVFLEHAGPYGTVTVYHVFKDDNWGAGTRAFWFGLTPYASDEASDNGEFDVRELKAAEGADLGGWLGDEGKIDAVIRAAIESGELRWPLEDDEDEDEADE